MLLATDLDGTFIGGESLHRQQLFHLVRNNKDAPGLRNGEGSANSDPFAE